MADNKRWFKVWTSLLTDPEFDEIPNQSIGAWVRLGALVAQHGESGEITVSKQQLLKRTNLNEIELINIIPSLLKINVEIKNGDNGTCFVSFKQWAKYQTDWNSYERLKKFRNTQNETKHETVQDKKRREEKRIRREENNYPDWLPLKEFSAYKEMRKTIRKHLTKKAEELAIKKLEELKKEGHDPIFVLEQSTFNSWQGLFPLKIDTAQQIKKNVSLRCKYDNNKPCYKDCAGCELTGKGA